MEKEDFTIKPDFFFFFLNFSHSYGWGGTILYCCLCMWPRKRFCWVLYQNIKDVTKSRYNVSTVCFKINNIFLLCVSKAIPPKCLLTKGAPSESRHHSSEKREETGQVKILLPKLKDIKSIFGCQLTATPKGLIRDRVCGLNIQWSSFQ